MRLKQGGVGMRLPGNRGVVAREGMFVTMGEEEGRVTWKGPFQRIMHNATRQDC
jgi:hypothetical protein